MSWPDPILRLGLYVYRALWWLMLPIIYLYLRRRARADPLYAKHISERFGRATSKLVRPVWIHAVSLGEVRSAVPLIRALLAQGDHVVTTHFTPTGRREAQRVFAPEIIAGQVQVVWMPFELSFAYKQFLQQFEPRLGLVMEIEVWPTMIASARRFGIPLYMCNAQYPLKSFVKDQRGLGLRGRLFTGFMGGFVKSAGQAERFAKVGMKNIHITGELRFDQSIPQGHLDAAAALKTALAAGREVITLTSVVEGEDATYIDMMKAAPDKLFIYVPRAPERFNDVADMITKAGLNVARRTQVLNADLSADHVPKCDVLLGDSMGEMYFYLKLCDRAIVGGGFVPQGAHNIIEPLALRKPVVVGPYIWTITYPVTDAEAAGVCTIVPTQKALVAAIQSPSTVSTSMIDQFYDKHAGGVNRTVTAINALHPR